MNNLFNLSQILSIKFDDVVKITAAVLIVAVILLRRQRKLLQKETEEDRQKLYQISVLKEIQDKIGYSLDLENMVEVIIGSLKNLFPYSTVASLIYQNDKLTFNVVVGENISSYFVMQVKKNDVCIA